MLFFPHLKEGMILEIFWFWGRMSFDTWITAFKSLKVSLIIHFTFCESKHFAQTEGGRGGGGVGQPGDVVELRGEGRHVGGGGGRALDGRGEQEAGGGAGLHWSVIIILIIIV